ncbi:TatD family hydrolase [Pseudoalteromonas sp. T1lg22]|uniref:TatD family hydrolase n=1 Tax=Pseudoalteromonas sp. T1lg22 TaxID=2077096 RepID=UPI000CF626E0|nr:TatD family hydrolase [Pseudoalteromonas sp. T1lg22]
MRFIDSHCHLDFSEFDEDRAQCIANALSLGVTHLVVPGVSLAQCKNLLTFTKQYPTTYISAGLHPYFLAQHHDSHIAELSDLIAANRDSFVAVGECGLDRSIGELEKQQSLFEAQIALANEFELPLIVHHRQSHDLIAASFKRCPPKFGGVIHAFSGSQQVAQSYIKAGFKLGVGGTITYPRAQKTQQALRHVGVEHLLLETDAPSMPLCGYQGQRNTPERIPNVFLALAALLQRQDYEALSEQLYLNCLAFVRK